MAALLRFGRSMLWRASRERAEPTEPRRAELRRSGRVGPGGCCLSSSPPSHPILLTSLPLHLPLHPPVAPLLQRLPPPSPPSFPSDRLTWKSDACYAKEETLQRRATPPYLSPPPLPLIHHFSLVRKTRTIGWRTDGQSQQYKQATCKLGTARYRLKSARGRQKLVIRTVPLSGNRTERERTREREQEE